MRRPALSHGLTALPRFTDAQVFQVDTQRRHQRVDRQTDVGGCVASLKLQSECPLSEGTEFKTLSLAHIKAVVSFHQVSQNKHFFSSFGSTICISTMISLNPSLFFLPNLFEHQFLRL